MDDEQPHEQEPTAPEDLDTLAPLDPLDEEEPSVRRPRPARGPRTPQEPRTTPDLGRMLGALVLLTGLLGLGFAAMLVVLESRPQFAGWGLAPERRTHEQGEPTLVVRTAGRPTHEVRTVPLDEARVELDLVALQDWRGLQVTRYLQGTLRARMAYTNGSDEDEYLAWHLPLPEVSPGRFEPSQAELAIQGLEDSELLTSASGWIVTGRLPKGTAFELDLEHPLAPLSELSWAANQGAHEQAASLSIDGDPVPLRLLGAGPGAPSGAVTSHRWAGRSSGGVGVGFSMLRGYSVYDALERLLQIAPLVAGMFLVTLLSTLSARRTPRMVELLLIACAYAYYFPLVVYLNANMPMKWAIPIAFVASAVVVLNYLRFLIGGRAGVLLGLALLVAFQLVPTMMAFAQWDRGLVLLSLGSISLLALVNLQTRRLKESLGSGAMSLAALLPLPLQDAEIRVSLPAELLPPAPVEVAAAEEPPEPGELLFGVASYELQWNQDWIGVEAVLPLECTGAAPRSTRVLGPGVFLESVTAPAFLRSNISGAGLDLHLMEAGRGEVVVRYRVPALHEGGQSSALVPAFLTTVGTARLTAERSALDFPQSPIWTRVVTEEGVVWTLGVGTQPVWVTWLTRERIGTEPVVPEEDAGAVPDATEQADPEEDPEATPEPEPPAPEPPPLLTVYEIATLEAHHLTLIEADGRSLHFAEYELDAGAVPEAFDLILPRGATVSSISLDDREIEGVLVEDGRLSFPFTRAARTQTRRKVTVALELPPVELAFRGSLTLELPRTVGTEAELHWEVRGPSGFLLNARGTGMKEDTSRPINRFGSYSRTDSSRPGVRLADSLVPRGRTTVRFAYAQQVLERGLPIPR